MGYQDHTVAQYILTENLMDALADAATFIEELKDACDFYATTWTDTGGQQQVADTFALISKWIEDHRG